MSGSDRGKEPRDLGGFGIAVALILSTIIAGGISYSSGKESERRDQYPSEYSGYAKAQADRACVGMDGSSLFECVYNEIEASQETARAEQDLDAQQGMKFWALLMFFATMATAGVTLLGVHYVRLTLDKNSELLAESAKATDAMLDANKIAQDNLIIQNRPWITSIRVMHSLRKSPSNDSFAIFFQIVIKNTGNSPAKDVLIYHTGRIIDSDSDIPHFNVTEGASEAVLPPGVAFPCGGFTLVGPDVDYWIERNTEVVLYCRIEYRDSLAPYKRRSTEVTWRIEFGGNEETSGDIVHSAGPDGPQNRLT